MSESNQTVAKGEATALVQSTLDADVLTEYFHFADSPERRPLPFHNATAVTVDSESLSAGGTPVKSGEAADALTVTRITTSDVSAEVEFRYAPEGIRGTAKFKRDESSWELLSVSVVEA